MFGSSFISYQLLKSYSSATVQNLPIIRPDHTHILLHTGYTHTHDKLSYFKFETNWLLNPILFELVKMFGHLILKALMLSS